MGKKRLKVSCLPRGARQLIRVVESSGRLNEGGKWQLPFLAYRRWMPPNSSMTTSLFDAAE